MTREQTRDRIDSLVSIFVQHIVASQCDYIIPIENEGLALLLAGLSKTSDEQEFLERVIPFRQLPYIDKRKLVGKNCLLVDGTIHRGETLSQVANKLKDHYQLVASPTAILIKEEYPHSDLIAFNNKAVLDGNEYIWARQRLIEHVRDYIFSRYDDPPNWIYSEEDFSTFHKLSIALKSLGYSYTLPEVSDSWIRMTVDGIKVNYMDWLPNGVSFSDTHKIRVQIDVEQRTLRLLPLFSIQIEKSIDTTNSLQELISNIRRDMGLNLDIFRYSSVEHMDVYRFHKYVTIIGSILLLYSFLLRLHAKDLSISLDKLRLSDSSAIIYRLYEGHSFVNKLNKRISSENLDRLSGSDRQMFDFFGSENSNEKDFVPTSEYHSLSPEGVVKARLGLWAYQKHRSKEHLNDGLSLENLYELIPDLTHVAINRAIDTLIDGGVVKPITSIINNVVERRFTLAGESMENRFVALGMSYAFSRRNSVLETNTLQEHQ